MNTWGKPDDVIAERFSKKQIPGFFRKKIKLRPDEMAVEEKDGKVVSEYGPGRQRVFRKNSDEIILIDRSEKKVGEEVAGLLTKDGNKISIGLELGFKAILPENLIKGLLAEKKVLKADEIYSRIRSELFEMVLAPEIKKFKIGELYGNRKAQDSIKASLEVELKKTLEICGIELSSFLVSWKFSEDYEQLMKSKASIEMEDDEKELEFEEKLKDVEREAEMEQLKGKGALEDTKAEMESERVRKEVELELRKKESAEDTEEALEALKLKQMLDRQKKLKEEE